MADWADKPHERRQADATDSRLNDLWIYRLGIVEDRSESHSESIASLQKQLIEMPQHYLPRREHQAEQERQVTVQLQRPIIIFAGGQFVVGLVTVLKVLGAF